MITPVSCISRSVFDSFSIRLQQVFRLAAILPSLKDGLIPQDGVTLSGDGTCVHSHASPYGHRVCKKASRAVPVNAISQIRTHTGAGTVMRKSCISAIPFTCSVPIMQKPGATCPSISVSWMPGGMTASAPSSPSGSSDPLTRISLSGTSVNYTA